MSEMDSPLPILRVASVLEVLTLLVLLGNLFTTHDPAVSAAIGPIHGFTYLAVVVCALLVEGTPTRVKVLAWIPVVGGLLALRAGAGTARDGSPGA